MAFDFLSPSSSSTANEQQVGVETGQGSATTLGGGTKGNATIGGLVLNQKNIKIASANRSQSKRLSRGAHATQPAAAGNGTTNPSANGPSNSGGVQTITTINTPDDNAINAIQHITELALALSDDENAHITSLASNTISGSQLLQGNQSAVAAQIAQNAQDQSAQIAESATTDPLNQTELAASGISGQSKSANLQIAIIAIVVLGAFYYMRKG